MYGVYTEFSGIQYRRCCNECLRRKVRCDGQRPCSNCQRRRHVCQYSLIRRKPPTPSYRSLTKPKASPSTSSAAATPTVTTPTASSTTPAVANAAKSDAQVTASVSQALVPHSIGATAPVHPPVHSTATAVDHPSSSHQGLDPLVSRLTAIVRQCEQLLIQKATPQSFQARMWEHFHHISPLTWLSGPDAVLTGLPDSDFLDPALFGNDDHLDINQVWAVAGRVDPAMDSLPLSLTGSEAMDDELPRLHSSTQQTISHPFLQASRPADVNHPRHPVRSQLASPLAQPPGTSHLPLSVPDEVGGMAAVDPANAIVSEPMTEDLYLYHPSIIQSLINLYFTRSSCFMAEAQQARFLRLLGQNRVDSLVLNTTLCIAARFSRNPYIAKAPAYKASLPYYYRAERECMAAVESPTLSTVVAFHHLTAWAIGQRDLSKLMMYSSLSSRMCTTLRLHQTDAPILRPGPSTWEPESADDPARPPAPAVPDHLQPSLHAVYTNVKRQVFWSIASTDFASALFSTSAPVTDLEAIAVQRSDEQVLSLLFNPNLAPVLDLDSRLPAIIPPTFITGHVPTHFTDLSLLIGKVATFRYKAAMTKDQQLDGEFLALNHELSTWYNRVASAVTLPNPDASDDILFQHALDFVQHMQFHARFQAAVILLNTRNLDTGATRVLGGTTRTIARTIAWNAAEWISRRVIPLAQRFKVEFHGPMTGGYLYYASWVYITELLAHRRARSSPLTSRSRNAVTTPLDHTTHNKDDEDNDRAPRFIANAAPDPQRSQHWVPSSSSSPAPATGIDSAADFPLASASSMSQGSSHHGHLSTSPLTDATHRSSSPAMASSDSFSTALQDKDYCIRCLYDIYTLCKKHSFYWAYNELSCKFIRAHVVKSDLLSPDQLVLFT
ncbi:hypothetical protein H4R35_003780 [Dimargaris xerosporica]|nr:hypothetical protein H4R35_003780 [Dimargaris xerosporica]